MAFSIIMIIMNVNDSMLKYPADEIEHICYGVFESCSIEYQDDIVVELLCNVVCVNIRMCP